MRRREARGALSPAMRLEIRERIAAGQTHAEVAAAIGCSTKTIQRLLLITGGLPPRHRARAARSLRIDEREEISRGLEAGQSSRAIAQRLGRAPSTVSREVRANGGRHRYRAWAATVRARAVARRPRATKLAGNDRLRRLVEAGLRRRWSPQQISHRLRRDHPDDASLRVSHETIYRALYVPRRTALPNELTVYLRRGQRRRRPRRHRPGEGRLGHMVPIADRPSEADSREVPGHWEGDLIMGKEGRSAMGALVERSTRYVLLVRLPNGRTAGEVRAALTRRINGLRRADLRSLTWDQGKEMAEHLQLTAETGIPVYFCNPRSPWQRATVENTNGLLRQYFPRTRDLSTFSEDEVTRVEQELNHRPRRILNWHTPAERFHAGGATTA